MRAAICADAPICSGAIPKPGYTRVKNLFCRRCVGCRIAGLFGDTHLQATGMIVLAVLGSLVIGIVMIVFVNRKSHFSPYIMLLTCESEAAEKTAFDLVNARCDKCVIKSKTVRDGLVELNMELRLKNDQTGFVNELSRLAGVRDVAMVSYNGDYLG